MQIKIYTADVRELDDPELFRFVYNGVSSDRKAKTDRMVFNKDKKLSLGAGALLEYVLAAHGVTDLTFTTEHNKKPRLANEDGIKFNISHSGTKVICAVSDNDIGCDVEQITDIDMEIAKRFFFAEEYEALMKCADRAERNKLFFRYWTLKESFMKATGLGFMLALDDFCILLDKDDISVRHTVDSRKYFFREFFLNDGYRYAVCSADKTDIPQNLMICSFKSLLNDNVFCLKAGNAGF